MTLPDLQVPGSARAADPSAAPALSREQRAVVEWGDGPLMVLAGAGTGKTTVVIERTARLIGRTDAGVSRGQVGPGNILVLTYNVRAAAELVERCTTRLGPAVADRTWILNFHGLGHRILRDHAADAGIPTRVEVLDAAGQRLLLRDVGSALGLVYHEFHDLRGQLAHLADVVNRARDELVTPDEYREHAAAAREAFEGRHGRGSFRATIGQLMAAGDLKPARDVRRALVRGGTADGARAAEREARRSAAARAGTRVRAGAAAGAGPGAAAAPRTPADSPQRPAPEPRSGTGVDAGGPGPGPGHDLRAMVEGLRPTFLRDAEALDVLRLQEEAEVFAAYLERLRERGAIDFGDQILRAVELLGARPNILRRYQRQFRHVLVDEFQDANAAQIMLLELLGRAPDRPDNVVVVGDDDQAVYRFRGASYAAFEQFRERFGRPPAWAPERAVAPVAEVTLSVNLRSSRTIVSAADRLIARNARRLKATPLRAAAAWGGPVELVVASDEHDEAEAVVDALRRALGNPDGPAPGATAGTGASADRMRTPPGPVSGAALPWASAADEAGSRPGPAPRWADAAVLYRRHRHRDVIEQHLRQAGIPFTVAGGAGLFDHADVRDIECALRVIARPDDSISATRLLAAPPWRLDATQVMRLARAAQFDGTTVVDAAARAIREGSIPVDTPTRTAPAADGSEAAPEPFQLALVLDPADPADPDHPAVAATVARPRSLAGRRLLPAQRPARYVPAPLPDEIRARLAPLVACITELGPRARRDAPFTVLDAYLSRAGTLRDLVASGAPDAQRSALAIAGLMRFVAGWQRDHPRAALVDFVDYLDAFQEVGGDVDADDDSPAVDAVRLMTVHQAKGLEWDVVIVPRLVEGQFPDDRADDPTIPVELLRQEPPPDFREAEERRLCYVAMTRARRHLVMTTIDNPTGRFRPSRFVAEIAADGAGAGEDVTTTVRGPVARTPGERDHAEGAVAARRPRPRDPGRRAAEIVGLLERLGDEAGAERAALTADLLALARSTGPAETRTGEDPGPLEALGADAGAGAGLLRLVPVLEGFSHSAFATYLDCPLAFAFQRVYRIPVPDEARPGYFAFGSMVHSAFEAFARAGQEARAAGAPLPGEPELNAFFDRAWQPLVFADRAEADTYRRRGPAVLRNFLGREASRRATAVCLEQPFRLDLDPGDGGPRARVGGTIDRIDRLADGRLELIDYKTGRPRPQAQVDADQQLSTYALAMRDGAVPDPETGAPLPAPAVLTLYFAEADEWISTTRTDRQLDEHSDRLLRLVARIRSGDFTARPDFRRCDRCDYRRMCPSRWGTPA